MKHQQTIKHHANLESGSSYAKLQASPAVANAYFREEWRNVYPWVTVDPSGNFFLFPPFLLMFTLKFRSFGTKTYLETDAKKT